MLKDVGRLSLATHAALPADWSNPIELPLELITRPLADCDDGLERNSKVKVTTWIFTHDSSEETPIGTVWPVANVGSWAQRDDGFARVVALGPNRMWRPA
jgi:hypothetical protein